MDREHELGEVRRHIAEGEEHVRRQRARIDELERDGHDVTSARSLLRTMEETLALHRESLAVLAMRTAGWPGE